MGPDGSLPCSQETATSYYPAPDESSPQFYHPFSLRSIPTLSFHLRMSLSLRLSNQNIARIFHLCHACYMPRPTHVMKLRDISTELYILHSMVNAQVETS